jgi:chromosome segregation protein
MFLKKLEVVGFKSFADRAEFSFEPGLTCLVGPNGCGKSNVVDAIKWALGEQSAKSLRGKEMADVIFNGSESRPPSGFAEASLTFDNESGRLPVEYAEVVITRRLYRAGESEYLINQSPVRLKDIRELFMDTGLGVQAYSVIEQGRIQIQGPPRRSRTKTQSSPGKPRPTARHHRRGTEAGPLPPPTGRQGAQV